jgi:hypothetical protein
VIHPVVVGHDVTERLERVIDAGDVHVLGLTGGAFDGEHLEGASFRDDVDEPGIHMAPESGMLIVLLPAVFGCYLDEFVPQLNEICGRTFWGKVVFVKDCFCPGDVGKEVPDGAAVDTKGGLFAADDVREVEAVGLVKGGSEQRHGDFEADVLEVCGGREVAFAELINVEGELSLDMRVRSLGVIDDGTILLFKAGEFYGDGVVDDIAVSDGVTDVVRERADGEGEVVDVLGVEEKAANKVAGADVVSEIGEESVTEGIVAEVLDGAPAVGIGSGLLELGVGEVGEAFEQDRADGVLPREIDDGFVGLDRVWNAGRGRQDKDEQR